MKIHSAVKISLSTQDKAKYATTVLQKLLGTATCYFQIGWGLYCEVWLSSNLVPWLTKGPQNHRSVVALEGVIGLHGSGRS